VINADGQDLSFVTVTVVDKDGIMVPDADNQVFFSLKGDGKIEAVDNGSQTSMEPFKAEQRRAFNGKCLVIVRSGNKPSNLMLKASSDGLQSAEIALRQTKN
jgi:beta-galactosidase